MDFYDPNQNNEEQDLNTIEELSQKLVNKIKIIYFL